MQKETAMKEEDALINERDGESPQAAATPSKDRDAKKRPKKEVADLGFEDEALQVEDLEPPGVAAAKVGLRTRTPRFIPVTFGRECECMWNKSYVSRAKGSLLRS